MAYDLIPALHPASGFCEFEAPVWSMCSRPVRVAQCDHGDGDGFKHLLFYNLWNNLSRWCVGIDTLKFWWVSSAVNISGFKFLVKKIYYCLSYSLNVTDDFKVFSHSDIFGRAQASENLSISFMNSGYSFIKYILTIFQIS